MNKTGKRVMERIASTTIRHGTDRMQNSYLLEAWGGIVLEWFHFAIYIFILLFRVIHETPGPPAGKPVIILLIFPHLLAEQELAPFTSRYRLLRHQRAFPSVFLDKFEKEHF